MSLYLWGHTVSNIYVHSEIPMKYIKSSNTTVFIGAINKFEDVGSFLLWSSENEE